MLSELKALHLNPLPGLRTIERVLHRHGLTRAWVRFAAPINPDGCQAPLADDSNRLHPVDIVGPFYLKGRCQQWYIFCPDQLAVRKLG